MRGAHEIAGIAGLPSFKMPIMLSVSDVTKHPLIARGGETMVGISQTLRNSSMQNLVPIYPDGHGILGVKRHRTSHHGGGNICTRQTTP